MFDDEEEEVDVQQRVERQIFDDEGKLYTRSSDGLTEFL